MTAPLYQPAVVKTLLRDRGFTLKKQFGQNFLIDGQVLRVIVEEAMAESDGEKLAALEIGPGVGTLTQALAEAGFEKVLAIEKDRQLIPILKETMSPYPQVEIISADALKYDFSALLAAYQCDFSIRAVANLPYYITTPIVMRLLEEGLPLAKMVVMVQKEVAERMVATPGGKEYGALSVAVQYYSEARILLTVPASAFLPNPSVDSAVVSLTMRVHAEASNVDRQLFFKVVRGSFQQRRKTLLNALAGEFQNLSKMAVSEWLKLASIDSNRRGETLTIREFAELARTYAEHIQPGV